MGRDRAWRRFQNKKVEKKAFLNFKDHQNFIESLETASDRNDTLLERAKYQKNNMTMCSCTACGNPRKWWSEITMQEKKANGIANSQDF
jgi:hypothetical protein